MRRLGSAVPIALALLAASCGSDDAGSDAATTTAAPSAETSTADAGGGGATDLPTQLDFTTSAVGGGEVAGADYAGQDTIVWFWAPW